MSRVNWTARISDDRHNILAGRAKQAGMSIGALLGTLIVKAQTFGGIEFEPKRETVERCLWLSDDNLAKLREASERLRVPANYLIDALILKEWEKCRVRKASESAKKR